MLYRALNHSLGKKISKLRPIIKNILNGDLKNEEKLLERKNDKTDVVAQDSINVDDVNKRIETIKKRLQTEKKYIIVVDHFRNDIKRKYMINQNYYKYLEALKYLYATSDIMVRAAVLTAPSEVYFAINEVEKSIDDLMKHYGLTM
jgi:hypothetical protein